MILLLMIPTIPMHIIVPDAPRQTVETGTGTAGRCAPGFGASRVYATNVEGTEATKVKLVVGRETAICLPTLS